MKRRRDGSGRSKAPSALLSRRSVFGAGIGAAGLAVAGCASSASRRAADARRERPDLPRPRPAQLAWQRAELGAVLHYDLHVFDGKKYRQAQNRVSPIADINGFAPSDYDVDQWFEAIVGMGARFAILTACHETGFRLWPSSAQPDYSTRALAWRDGNADLVADFVDACRRHGVAPGLYYGARWNSHLGISDFRPTRGAALTQRAYNDMVEREVEELCTRYGPLFELWFDGGILAHRDGGPDVVPIFERHQPGGLFYHSDERRDARWGGSESGTVPDPCWSTIDLPSIRTGRAWGDELRQLLGHGDPDGRDWCPAMADAPLRGARGRHEWFWEPGDERAVYDLDDLVDMYERSVGHNSTLIVGLTPDPTGRIPAGDTERCIEWGRAIAQRYGTAAARVGASVGREVVVELPRSTAVARVVLEEEIECGQRVRGYEVLGRRAGSREWVRLARGQSVGNKRIHALESTFATTAIKISVTQAVATPLLRSVAVFER